ncbi:hypothetical protein Q5752_005529 [Cryptotrichosporon argae]
MSNYDPVSALSALPAAVHAHLSAYLNSTAPALAALTSLEPFAAALAHLHETHLHASVPVTWFALLHAARVAVVWTSLTRGRGDVGLLQDLVGYLTTAWGGATAAALLLHQPPVWLVSPLPLILYTTVFAAFFRTGLARRLVSLSPAVLALAGAATDALTRGSSVSAVPALLAHASLPANAWTVAVLGAIGTNAGGWAVQLLGLHRPSWAFGRPNVLDGGALATLDVTSASAAALLYAALTGGLGSAGVRAGEKVDARTARAAAVALLAVALVGRAALLVGRARVGTAAEPKERAARTETASNVEKVVKTPASKGITQPRERRTTPRRSKTPA